MLFSVLEGLSFSLVFLTWEFFLEALCVGSPFLRFLKMLWSFSLFERDGPPES